MQAGVFSPVVGGQPAICVAPPLTLHLPGALHQPPLPPSTLYSALSTWQHTVHWCPPYPCTGSRQGLCQRLLSAKVTMLDFPHHGGTTPSPSSFHTDFHLAREFSGFARFTPRPKDWASNSGGQDTTAGGAHQGHQQESSKNSPATARWPTIEGALAGVWVSSG